MVQLTLLWHIPLLGQDLLGAQPFPQPRARGCSGWVAAVEELGPAP